MAEEHAPSSVHGIAVRLLAAIALFGAYALGWVRAMAVRPTATSSIDFKQTLNEISEMTGLLDKVIDANVTGATPLTTLYGHVHMAKTGGTSLNGLLANKFERVCGAKGYSYDAYADNERAKKDKGAGKRVTGFEWGRSRVKPAVMEMTGYENCDYISHEIDWSFWKTKFGEKRFHGMAMELHVPCRSPIDHLMSQCKHQHKALRCAGLSDEQFFRAIDSCTLGLNRFHSDLLNHFTVKCFDFRQQFTKLRENCDYVSHEIDWSFWKTKFGKKRFHGVAMELHVPCRSPIDHLMSQCNYRHKALRCAGLSDEQFFRAIDSCTLGLNRFHSDLLNHFTVKCFDFRQQFTKYIDHMARILQRRRFESTPYIKRETNDTRNKANECIWNNEEAYAKAEAYLISKYDYYQFCDMCMGSVDEITKNTTITD
ncbi:hypothetical protein ACHAXT_003772 [Thalassiosira profunda]